ncbi:flagellar basal body rod protein FlgB [Vagococcus sp. BWB3-3]|uniref:Flagellar basal body rod protein FlgB n=1 Tax=Vagococcus allomyrinae TaxID=2794353 RepID=A0A940P615_9ENTE|nr:flagellar basal body rod protein FlgB [Vagococcus allomyrinae]MBP1042052.1 flagellar basal body rod protein FlgB [Vagococcus allomyrinae]
MSQNNLDLLQKAMDAASTRQRTISNNIANVNTAGYKVERVVFEDKLKDALSMNELKLERTNDKHLTASGEVAGAIEPTVQKRTDTSIKENGNNVDIELEMSEKAVNELYYNTLTRQMNGELSLLNYVISH